MSAWSGARASTLPDGDGEPLALVLEADGDTDALAWAAPRRAALEAALVDYGAVLLRGFSVADLAAFEAVARALSTELLEYTYRSTPRTLIAGKVHTSTEYPREQSIFPHNESSYSTRVPGRLFLFSQVAARAGGETPLGSNRKILRRIPPAVVEEFRRRHVLYVRNYRAGLGLTWQDVFRTDRPADVEAFCRARDMTCEWLGDRLRTRQVLPALAAHPRTGEPIWFNHAAFFHSSSLGAELEEALLSCYAPDELPANTFFGDGGAIAPAAIAAIRAAYLAESIAFPWRARDLLIVDNFQRTHARRPFEGERKVFVALADPFDRPALPLPMDQAARAITS